MIITPCYVGSNQIDRNRSQYSIGPACQTLADDIVALLFPQCILYSPGYIIVRIRYESILRS